MHTYGKHRYQTYQESSCPKFNTIDCDCNYFGMEEVTMFSRFPLHWRHNDHDGVSNHQPHGYLLNRLFGRRSKKTSKLRVTGLCAGNSPGPVNSPHKGPVTRKMFPFDDVIMPRTRWPQRQVHRELWGTVFSENIANLRVSCNNGNKNRAACALFVQHPPAQGEWLRFDLVLSTSFPLIKR